MKAGRFDVIVFGDSAHQVAHFVHAVAGVCDRGPDSRFRSGGPAIRDVDLPGGERLRLHSGPGGGQRPHMLQPCTADADGSVVLVDVSAMWAPRQLAQCLGTSWRSRPGLPAAVGLTGLHSASASQYRACERWVHLFAPKVPAIPLQPCNPKHVRTLLQLLASRM